MKKQSFFAIAVLALTLATACSHTLFSDSRTEYSIVVRDGASPTEQFAAKDLQATLKQISGAEFPIVGKASGRHNIIIDGQEIDGIEDEAFHIFNRGGDIIIHGGSRRGAMYGVYDFLEKEFGCRWYTSKFSKIPELSEWKFSRIDISDKPAFEERHVFIYEAGDKLWSARNRNNSIKLPDADGNGSWDEGSIYGFNGCHSFGKYVPFSRYGQEHPEYFSEIDGKRKSNQLCLTNPDVYRLCLEGVREDMKNTPYRIIDLSQNDGDSDYCCCERCRALADSLGGNQTDVLMWFLNKVADEVKDEFPDKYLGTLAYTYTVDAPLKVKPHSNVVIRLCTGDNCLIHPIDECPEDTAFMKNIDSWSNMAERLYIWDYVATFRQYYAPYPNFRTFQPNVRMFRSHKAVGVLELGEYQCPGGDFVELKSYLLSKILWNPDCDVEAIIDEFFTDYYGEAAEATRAYFEHIQSLSETGIHENCFQLARETKLYSEEFSRKSLELAAKAEEAAASNSTMLSHVRMATLSAYYLHCRMHPAEALNDGSLDKIRETMDREGITLLSEWGDVKQFWQLEYMMKWEAGLI